MIKQSKKILLLFCLSLLTATCAWANEISVTSPWIREAPPVAEMLAAYMTISNNSKHTVQLESATSADFEMVEIHRTETHEGMSRMIKQSSLQVEGGKNVMLEPGGYHLMLMKPMQYLKAGEKVMLELHFSNGEVINVTAVVRKQ
jgi:periplasmic copper chaperone A